MSDDVGTNTSIIGRLLEEISWEGKRVVHLYRGGGRGKENVLTAEVMISLDFLPRTHFLAEVLRAAHGAEAALGSVAAQIEDCELSVLPPQLTLKPAGTVVQPDALLEAANGYVLVEAKGMRRASFGPQQLAREYLAVIREAKTRNPVLLLILGSPPPFTVKKQGPKDIPQAIRDNLQAVMDATGADELFDDLVDRIPDVVSWITWAEVNTVVTSQLSSMKIEDPSLRGTVERLAKAVSAAITIHS
jgi:hypothetical protein